MSAFVTTAGLEVLSIADPKPRVTTASLEVLSVVIPNIRVTKVFVEVAVTPDVIDPAGEIQPVVCICT